jgi:hypothetical protein
MARVRRLAAAEGWTHRRRRKDRDEESRYEAPPGRVGQGLVEDDPAQETLENIIELVGS